MFFIVALVSTWLVLLYHIFLIFGGYRYFIKSLQYTPSINDSQCPFVTILIPAHNEDKVIGRTLDALSRLDYPQQNLEIIVINDSSTDNTGKVLEEKKKKIPHLKVVTIEPPLGAKGKSNALNNGLKMAKGEFIAVYDADNTPERPALRYLIDYMVKDEAIGAVVGKFRTRNRDASILTRFINIETLSFQWLCQAGRYHWFRLTTIPGTNYVIRRKILEELGGYKVDALTEDTELTIRIYGQGYYIVWAPHAVTWEQEPESIPVWVKQRTRWARGNMWVAGYYLSRLFNLNNRRITWDILYFISVYFIFFSSIIISDVVFVLSIMDLIHLTVGGPLLVLWLMAYSLFILETFIPLSLEQGETSLKNFLYICIMYFTYSQLWLYLVFRAIWISFRDKVKGKAFYWDKTERSDL